MKIFIEFIFIICFANICCSVLTSQSIVDKLYEQVEKTGEANSIVDMLKHLKQSYSLVHIYQKLINLTKSLKSSDSPEDAATTLGEFEFKKNLKWK